MRRLLTILTIAVAVGACSGGSGGSPPSTVASTVPTVAPRVLAGIPEPEIQAFVTERLTIAADVVAARLERGTDGYAGAFALVLDGPSTARATVACEELSLFVASHPTVTGVSRVTVLRDGPDQVEATVVVVNDGVRPGDVGVCEVA